MYCARKVAKYCCSVWASFHQGDINRGECLKSPDIMGRRRGNCVVAVVVYCNYGASAPHLALSLHRFLFTCLLSHFPDSPQHPVLFCFALNRHTHAQLVLRRLQARAMRPAFIWSCDQVGVLLCQYGVRLWRTLPALPTAKLWYRCSNHYTHTHTHTAMP